MTRPRDCNVQLLRLRAAVHHFKRMLVPYHQPGRAQPSDVFTALEKLGYREVPEDRRPVASAGVSAEKRSRLWTRRTWQSWFAENVEVPKRQKLEVMDEVAANKIRWVRPRDNECLRLPEGFYSELVDGGLLKTMLSKTKSQHPEQVLRARADSYEALSAWHLHFDALDARHHREDFYGVPWSRVVQIAAERVLEILHHQWAPRRGAIYAQLSSDLQAQWDAASNESKEHSLRKFEGSQSPNRERLPLANLTDHPSWLIVGDPGDDAPVRIHLMLYAIGADARFVSPGDHLAAWAFDLATAGIVSRALAWSLRGEFARELSNNELFVINSIDSLLFAEQPVKEGISGSKEFRERYKFELDAAALALRGHWDFINLRTFLSARSAYRAELSSLGINVSDLGLSLRPPPSDDGYHEWPPRAWRQAEPA